MATIAVVPADGTFLDTFSKSFVDVPVDAANDNAIDTTTFLEAAESLTTMFDMLGSVAFSPVKNDMLGNVKKIRERQLAAPGESATLQALVINEIKAKKHVAAEGLLWLVRGLDFTYQALSKNVAEESEELAESFRNAYGNTLKPFHNFLIKPIFAAAMSACPFRKDFYAKLSTNQTLLQEKLREYLAALGNIVEILKTFVTSKAAKW